MLHRRTEGEFVCAFVWVCLGAVPSTLRAQRATTTHRCPFLAATTSKILHFSGPGSLYTCSSLTSLL